MPIRLVEEVITPNRALELLKFNTNNRPIRAGRLKAYTNDMVNGRWIVGGCNPIKVTESGILLNGQHRLHAIVASGISIREWVALDVPDDAMSVEGRDIPRSYKDNRTISGHAGLHDSLRVSCMRYIFHLTEDRWRSPSDGELNDIESAFGEEIEWSMKSFARKGVVKNARQGAVAAAFAMAYPVNPSMVEDAASQLTSGVGIVENGSVLSMITAINNAVRRSHRYELALKLLVGLSAHVAGKPGYRLHPTINGLEWVIAERRRLGLPIGLQPVVTGKPRKMRRV